MTDPAHITTDPAEKHSVTDRCFDMPMNTAGPVDVECDESEFVVSCFAVCAWNTFAFVNGQIHIRAMA